MGDEESKVSNLRALLIGIDCYMPNVLPSGGSYKNLQGCVRDILQVEQFLRDDLGLPAERILKLTASKGDTSEPSEPRERWPTYQNMVAAFQELAEAARSGEQVYIHYSGHGGRAVTQYPQLKGANGRDEALVPTDIGDAGTQYLRDVELHHLIKSLVDKEALVTVVLDSCHAGSATRSLIESHALSRGGAVARTAVNADGHADHDLVDTTSRTAPSAVATAAELVAAWRASAENATRNLKPGAGWLLEPRGYVLLAACRPSEYAYEFPFDGSNSSGALTYWLLDALRQPAADLTYKRLYDFILAKVHSQFEGQTPLLQGEADRVAFGGLRVRPRYAVGVLQVDQPNGRVLLHAGQAQGVRPGATFAVYPSGTADFTRTKERLALVELTELGATESWAKVVEQFGPVAPEQGQQAVLLHTGATRPGRVVRVLDECESQPDAPYAGALRGLDEALSRLGDGVIRMAADGEAAECQVFVSREGEYSIRDAAGVEIPNLRPALRSGQDGATERLAERLVHLSRYRDVRELDNYDSTSPLAGKLVVEAVGRQASFVMGERPMPEPFGEDGDAPKLKVGEWLFIRIRNDSAQVLNVAVLNLQPDWGVTQIYPAGAALFESLDVGQEITLPLCAALPAGCVEGTDVIKVFATVGAPNFRWLELPALGEPTEPVSGTRGAPTDPLEQLLLAASAGTTRNLKPAAYASGGWVTRQLEIYVRE
jgi:hypothetical protein